jgi:hypothetical protein
VTNPAKVKGDAAEREIAAILADLTGWPVRRKLGAGRQDDVGDLDGIPETVAQVAYRPSHTLDAVRQKPIDAERQRVNAGATFAFAAIRFRGGEWRCVLTVDQMATLLREAT